MLEKQINEMKENMDIGIEAENRKEVVGILNILLADEYLLFTKTRNYHWNVVGKDFKERHEFFQQQYEKLDGMIDEIAEQNQTIRRSHSCYNERIYAYYQFEGKTW